MEENKSITTVKNQNAWNLSHLVDNTNVWLNKLVSWIWDDEKKKKKLRPIPSINVMKKRLIEYFTEKRDEIISSFRSLFWNPFKLNDTIDQVRRDNVIINEYMHKDWEEIRKSYFKYFWHLHGIHEEKK